MFSKNQIPRVILFSVLFFLTTVLTSPQVSADVIIAGHLRDAWHINKIYPGEASNSLLARTGDIQNPLVGDIFTNSTSRMQWNRTGAITDVNAVHEFSYFKPGGDNGGGVQVVGVRFASGIDVYAPAGTTVRIDWFGGQLSTLNASTDVWQNGVGTSLTPWTHIETVTAHPSRRIVFEGREYFGLFPRPIIIDADSLGPKHEFTTGNYNGTFNWRVTNLSFVPEPGSMVLVGLVGLTALGARRRFRFTRSVTSDSCSTPIEQPSK